MKEKDIVKFKEPLNEDEKSALMVVIEMRDDRVLVGDLRFSDWDIPPTSVYSVNDLEVVHESAKDSFSESIR
jgi:hypothetical protein